MRFAALLPIFCMPSAYPRLVSGTLVSGGRAALTDAPGISLRHPTQYEWLIDRYCEDASFRALYDVMGNIAAIEWYKGMPGAESKPCSFIKKPYITADGAMYPCEMLPAAEWACPMSVFEHPVEDCLKAFLPTLVRLKEISRVRRETLDACRGCAGQRHCGGGCMGRAFAGSGQLKLSGANSGESSIPKEGILNMTSLAHPAASCEQCARYRIHDRRRQMPRTGKRVYHKGIAASQRPEKKIKLPRRYRSNNFGRLIVSFTSLPQPASIPAGDSAGAFAHLFQQFIQFDQPFRRRIFGKEACEQGRNCIDIPGCLLRQGNLNMGRWQPRKTSPPGS